jgi:DNA-binding response OmpR family regulator
MRVLIVEDEERLAETIARGLRRRGMTVDVANDGVDGLHRALESTYDVVVLDRDLPALHGDEVCRRLVEQRADTRVLMLTAAGALEDLVTGLGLGADDFMAKPFEFAELHARLLALGRRANTATPVVLRWGDVQLDPARRQARRRTTDLALTPRELDVLELLMRAAGGVVSAEQLLERAWDEHADPFTTAVRVIMSRLRSKLGEPAVIETVIGRGYRLIEPSRSP